MEAGDGTYDIVNPASEQVVGQAPNASVADADAAAAAAKEAFPAWAATPAEERLALLKQAAAAIRAKGDELVPLVIAETGATASVGSRMQVPVSAARFDRYSKDISHIQEHMLPPVVSEATPLAPGGLISALAYRQPVGVVGRHRQLQLPDDQHGRQGGSGPGHGQHGDHEAGPPGSAGRDRDGPGARRGRASHPA